MPAGKTDGSESDGYSSCLKPGPHSCNYVLPGCVILPRRFGAAPKSARASYCEILAQDVTAVLLSDAAIIGRHTN